MLQFLQTGKVLYVLAAVCALGIISKLVTGNLYKRLIKETGNMALTKNRNLRALKQKTENMFLLSHGLRNPAAYIEKQVYGFRFMKISLDDWDNFSVQTMILCFLIGGVAAFGSYWYRCDSYYIVLYGTMGILSGLFMVLVDNGVSIGVKRQQLMDCLVDYVENSPHFYKNVDKAAEGERADRKNRIVPAAGPGFRDLGRRGLKAVEETAASNETGHGAGNTHRHSALGARLEGLESLQQRKLRRLSKHLANRLALGALMQVVQEEVDIPDEEGGENGDGGRPSHGTRA